MSRTDGFARGRRDEPVPLVTTASVGRSDDINSRQKRYLIMMSIRIACLPLALVTTGWLRWVFIFGAVVLPYVAVVIANATSRPSSGTIEPVYQPRPALSPARAPKDRIDPQ
ncbi:MAG TPA: DUF3099 domain-containing protein [Jiangellaceae bacterium]|nr:DUF3099 domain-containing protein [Jiangellaceae bacterium]